MAQEQNGVVWEAGWQTEAARLRAVVQDLAWRTQLNWVSGSQDTWNHCGAGPPWCYQWCRCSNQTWLPSTVLKIQLCSDCINTLTGCGIMFWYYWDHSGYFFKGPNQGTSPTLKTLAKTGLLFRVKNKSEKPDSAKSDPEHWLLRTYEEMLPSLESPMTPLHRSCLVDQHQRSGALLSTWCLATLWCPLSSTWWPSQWR